MRDDLKNLDQIIEEKKKQGILTLISKEKLDRRKEKEQKNYEENVLPKILKLTKKKDRIYFDQGKNKRYKEIQKKINKIIKETPTPWKEMANKRKRVQELFNSIEHDLTTLTYWKGGNPWVLLSIRSEEAVAVGFARYATIKELKQINKGRFKGQWIRFRSETKNDWETIVPEKPDSSVAEALFFALHGLRKSCKERAQEYKRKQ